VHDPRVIVVGAGVGGLAAAARLAHAGCRVTVLERAAGPGGKMRVEPVGDAGVDAGPTVLTMRWVFDDLCASLGTRFDDWVNLAPAAVLARHAWHDSARLDLYADLDASADAVGRFAGVRERDAFLRFHAAARRMYDVLREPFLLGQRTHALGLSGRIGYTRLGDLLAIRPFTTLWSLLDRHFKDPRLRQLYGRYATYCGSSPFAAPATLALVAHVEQCGVWLVNDGMHGVARGLAGLAQRSGATLRYDTHVQSIEQRAGRACGVRLTDGTHLAADAIVCNADPAAIAAGCFGAEVAGAVPRYGPRGRSLSAVTWAVHARTRGFALQRHNVFFSSDYAAEFRQLHAGRLPEQPTVYVCAQDRDDGAALAQDGLERLLCLVNAPATGDHAAADPEDIERCEHRTFQHLERLGLTIERSTGQTVRTAPTQFHQRFPATGGALYGRATHGWRASFQRPGARTRLPGLYLAGGSTHPGPGVPMAALSGRLAVASVLADLASTSASSRVAMPGGISTR
jgi:1-hydroxycarotenoid 3,4-desaturase